MYHSWFIASKQIFIYYCKNYDYFHNSDGVGRTGTYCLIDMTLARISSGIYTIVCLFCHSFAEVPALISCKYFFMFLPLLFSGAKEINLAATIEHLRDQRPMMVKRKVAINLKGDNPS